MLKNILLAVSIAVAGFTVTPTVEAKSVHPISIQAPIMGEGVIYQVIDGDTIWLNVNSSSVFAHFQKAALDTKPKAQANKEKALRPQYRSVKMRIANINTDESVHRDKSKNSASGKVASNYLKGVAEKRNAQFVCWDHGRYGRPICSVEFKANSGKFVDIGYRMISQGYSEYLTKYGRHPYAHKEYQKAEK